jgi:hypothetical protein
MSNTSPTPPRPRRWLRWFKRLGWCALWLVTLIALLVVFENWRGRRAWRAFVAESKAAGEDLRPEAVIPPPVPAVENFAAIPLFGPLFDYTNARMGGIAGEAVWGQPEAKKRLDEFTISGSKSPTPAGGWRAGKFSDLKAWQAHYRAQTNFPMTPEPQSPGRDVLLALGKFDAELAQLREGAARPHARFPIRYEESLVALLPHLSVMKGFVRLPQLRAEAELAEGLVDAAKDDAVLGLRIAESLRSEPILISQLVRMALLELALAPVWEGLARGSWSEAHLAEFERQLARINYLESFQSAMRGERNLLALAGLELQVQHPEFFIPLDDTDLAQLDSVRWTPRSFIDQSKVNIGRLYNRLVHAADPQARRFRPEVGRQIEADIKEVVKIAWRKPYHILAALLTPAVSQSIEKFARAQTTVDLARVAIALERHRLKHGALPETLEAIDPALKPAGGVPHDVISGGPLRYARTADGRFHLYAVGWNGTDEGGSIVWKNAEKTQIDFTQGDWVWPQPAK